MTITLLGKIDELDDVELPLAGESVPAGFPSPASDYEEDRLSLLKLLVKRPEATYLLRVAGESMLEAGIHDGDVLVVDKAEEPRNGSVVIATVDGEFTVKRVRQEGGRLLLLAQNPAYKPIVVTPENDFIIWGVVLWSLHPLGGRP